jgi:hypothetical protein
MAIHMTSKLTLATVLFWGLFMQISFAQSKFALANSTALRSNQSPSGRHFYRQDYQCRDTFVLYEIWVDSTRSFKPQSLKTQSFAASGQIAEINQFSGWENNEWKRRERTIYTYYPTGHYQKIETFTCKSGNCYLSSRNSINFNNDRTYLINILESFNETGSLTSGYLYQGSLPTPAQTKQTLPWIGTTKFIRNTTTNVWEFQTRDTLIIKSSPTVDTTWSFSYDANQQLISQYRYILTKDSMNRVYIYTDQYPDSTVAGGWANNSPRYVYAEDAQRRIIEKREDFWRDNTWKRFHRNLYKDFHSDNKPKIFEYYNGYSRLFQTRLNHLRC